MRIDSTTRSEVNGYYAGLRPEVMKYVPESAKTVIEVGCGNGSFGFQLKSCRGCEVCGIELNDEAGREAKKKLD